jgi:hypothetical protein
MEDKIYLFGGNGFVNQGYSNSALILAMIIRL